MAEEGIYSVTISGNGCTPVTSTININVLQIATPTVNYSDSICEGTNLVASITNANTDYVYNWTTPGGIITTNDSLIIGNAGIIDSGTYTITANQYNCESAETLFHIVVLETPVANFTVNTPICVNETLQFSSPSSYEHYWYNAQGLFSNSQNPLLIASDTSLSGYYTLILKNIFCVSQPTFTDVAIYTYPTLNSTQDTVVCNNSILNLTASSDFPNYTWNTGETNSVINIPASGTYWVSSANHQCVTTDTIRVDFEDCDNLGTNIFTPNDDGVNDRFLFNSKIIKSINLIIYDRWGLKVFEYTDSKKGWNGKYLNTNKDCTDGTYFYIGNVTMLNDNTKDLKGFITLIR